MTRNLIIAIKDTLSSNFDTLFTICTLERADCEKGVTPEKNTLFLHFFSSCGYGQASNGSEPPPPPPPHPRISFNFKSPFLSFSSTQYVVKDLKRDFVVENIWACGPGQRQVRGPLPPGDLSGKALHLQRHHRGGEGTQCTICFTWCHWKGIVHLELGHRTLYDFGPTRSPTLNRSEIKGCAHFVRALLIHIP